MTNPANQKARTMRLDYMISQMKTMLENCSKQELLGVPASDEEKKMYATLGLVLSQMLNKDDNDFEGMARDIQMGIMTTTGVGVGSIPTSTTDPTQFQAQSQTLAQQPQGSAEAHLLATHLANLVVKLVQQHGVPVDVATSMAMDLAKDLIEKGAPIDQIANIDVKVFKAPQPSPQDDIAAQLARLLNNQGFPF